MVSQSENSTPQPPEPPLPVTGRRDRRRFLKLSPREFPIALALVAALAFAYQMWVSYTQWASHRTYVADVGLYNYILSGFWEGRFFVSPLAPQGPGNFLGVHFSPILLVLSPAYLFSDHCLTLLAILNLGIVAAIFPLAWFAFQVTGDRVVGFLFALAYLTNHFVASIHLANHLEALAFVSLFSMFYALERKWGWLYWIGFAWTCLIIETFAPVLIVFGATLLLEKEPWKRRTGKWTMGLAAGWVLVAIIGMHLSGRSALIEVIGDPYDRYGAMGDSLVQVVLYFVMHPAETASRLFSKPLFHLFLSVGFLAVLDYKGIWAGIAGAAIFLLTADVFLHNLLYYYSYAAIPFLFYSAVRGSGVLLSRGPERLIRPLLLLLLIVLAVVSFPLVTRTDGYRRLPFPVEYHHQVGNELVSQIPADAPVAAQWNLYCVVPTRENLLPLRMWSLPLVDWVYLDVTRASPDWVPHEGQQIYEVLQSPQFEEVENTEGYFIFQRVARAED